MYQDRDLLDILCDLNFRFNHHGGSVGGNILERYAHFKTYSEKKKRCNYALKCRDLFLRHDYDEIRKLILEAAEMIKEIEPGNDPPILSSPHEEEEDWDGSPRE